jgi:hypothetical protein
MQTWIVVLVGVIALGSLVQTSFILALAFFGLRAGRTASRVGRAAQDLERPMENLKEAAAHLKAAASMLGADARRVRAAARHAADDVRVPMAAVAAIAKGARRKRANGEEAAYRG